MNGHLRNVLLDDLDDRVHHFGSVECHIQILCLQICCVCVCMFACVFLVVYVCLQVCA